MEDGASSYRRFLDGDESAFTVLLELYRDPVTFFIQRYVHDLCAAEDIAADVFMQLVVHPRRYNFKTSLRTYLFMLARSRALDWLRHKKVQNAVPLDDMTEQLADSRDLEEHILQEERNRQLHQAIAQLPQEQQVAVHLVYFESLSYEETAKVMRKTKKQVDNLLYRAKQSLRAMLGEEGMQ